MGRGAHNRRDTTPLSRLAGWRCLLPPYMPVAVFLHTAKRPGLFTFFALLWYALMTVERAVVLG